MEEQHGETVILVICILQLIECLLHDLYEFDHATDLASLKTVKTLLYRTYLNMLA